MRDHELAVVEHRMADEPVEEVTCLRAQLIRLRVELLECLRQPVRDLDVSASQLARELHVVVSGQADCGAGLGHRHHEPQDSGGIGTTIAVVANEHRTATVRRDDVDTVLRNGVTECPQQRGQLAMASVNVAYDVEGSALGAAIAPERRTCDLDVRDLLGRVQHPHVSKALAPQSLDRPVQLGALSAHDMRPEITVGARAVALLAERLR